MGNEWSRIEESIVFVSLDTKRAEGMLQLILFDGDDTNRLCFEEYWNVLKRGRNSFIFHFGLSKPEEYEYDGYNVEVH